MKIPLSHFQMRRAGTGQGWKTGSSEPAYDKRTLAKARPLGVRRHADLIVNTDEITGFHTGLPLMAVDGKYTTSKTVLSVKGDKSATGSAGFF